MKVKIGQVLTLKEDVETTSFLTDKKTVYKAGTEILITARGFAVYPDGIIQKLDRTYDVAGYDIEAISSRISSRLRWQFDLADSLGDEELDEFKSEIAAILEEVLD
ncbi:hypothetical protein [Acetobacterium wieringae]|uniref:hypothetical protein n=1 Tax=Acetobacterium wieringae TaxID=52694 RepID=UPI002B212E5C|nr:hypothetical protein [Acetobacterium wieringae]MEA4805133.1 hypothetical protein [Acetobacterium wieringae]